PMIRAAERLCNPHASTRRQRSIRSHTRGLPLKSAIRYAVEVCFRFKCRAVQGKALWSETERVWMGSSTCFHWAISLQDIDIPRAVATAADAPKDMEQLPT